jgi:nicotinamide-nucleotide amidase
MLKASVISIGNELLTGRAVDTNSVYLNSQLFPMGVKMAGVYTVGDDKADIVRVLRQAAETSDIILITGGLGPTDDDVTRYAISEFLSCPLVLDNRLLDIIKHFFEKRGKQFPQRNKIQAYLPKDSSAMENPIGTAAGIKASFGGKMLFTFPGVPAEMEKMFHEFAEPAIVNLLENSNNSEYVSVRRLKCCGTGESNIAEMLGELMGRGCNPEVNCTVSDGIITIEIRAIADSQKKANKLTQDYAQLIQNKLGKLVFSNNDRSLVEIVADKLREKSQTVSFAESCTGGLVSKLITDIPGSSEYFTQSWVTYSNDAKSRLLGVPEELLEKYGAVSKEVAEAMGKGAKEKSGADYIIALTGIAGPAGGTEQKPVGSVYINITGNDLTDTQYYIFPGSRDMVRKRTANAALNTLRLHLLD